MATSAAAPLVAGSAPPASAPAASASSASSLPARCPHCQSERDYSEHHGISFCNACGKKVSSTSAPGAAAATSKLSPAPQSPIKAAAPFTSLATAADPSLLSTPPRASHQAANGDPTAEEDEDDVVSFKHAVQSPAPPPPAAAAAAGPSASPSAVASAVARPAPPSRPPPAQQSRSGLSDSPITVMPSSAAATSTPQAEPAAAATPAAAASAAPNQSAAPASSSAPVAAAASSAPASAASASSSSTGTGVGTGTQITLSEEEFAALEASIRAEVVAASAAENEILGGEFEALERTNAALVLEKRELQRTMEEMMDSYARLVEEAAKRKSDFTAATSLLEAEVATLRAHNMAAKSELASLRDAHVRLQSDSDTAASVCSEHRQELDRVRAENESFRERYEKLRVQAQEKLSQSAMEYKNVLARATEREAALAALRGELDAERARATAAEELLAKQQAAALADRARLASLEAAGESARAEALDLRSQLRASHTELARVSERLEESSAVSERFKAQLLEHRERLREADDAAKRTAALERESAQRLAEHEALTRENQQLKSQLFDSMQVEKALKAQLEGGGMCGATVADVSSLARLEGEVSSLRAQLATKETEHKELMAICTDLIGQVEASKAANGASSASS